MIGFARQWRTLIALFQQSRAIVVASTAAAVAQSLSLVPIALIVRHVFDTQIPAGDSGPIIASGAAVLGLFVLNGALGLFTRRWILVATKRAVTELRVDLVAKLYALPRSYFDRADLGALHATLIQDTERVDTAANALMGQVLPAWLIAFALGATLAFVSPFLFALLVAVGPVLALLARRLGGAGRSWAGRYHSDYDSLASHAQVALRAMTLTKALGAEDAGLAARRREAEAVERSSTTMSWLLVAYTLAQTTIAATAGVIVLVVGGASVASGSMSLGSLLAFYAVVALLRGQLATVTMATPLLISGSDSLSRIKRILDADEPQPYSGSRALEWSGAVALERVRFGYGEQLVLDGVDLEVAPGERVALLGPNGAGKSTILSLLLGLYRPWEGCLRADGVPFDELDLRRLRRRLGVVLQDPILFRGSVYENVCYGCPEASRAEALDALELAGSGSMLAGLKDGLDAEVGDEGTLLSGGERQRLAIARAFVRRPALIVLDEPSVHLDEAGTGDLLDSLTELPGPPAALVVTHDPVVAAFAERSYVLRGGRVAVAADPSGAKLEAMVGE